MGKYRKLTTRDIDWLKERTCPGCGTKGRLLLGMHPRERLTCQECGVRFIIKGRKKEKK